MRQKGLSRLPSGQIGKRRRGWSNRISTPGVAWARWSSWDAKPTLWRRTEEFRALAHDIAMQVAAMSPVYLSADEMEEGDDRPAAQVCLLQQPFIKDGSRTLDDLVKKPPRKPAKTSASCISAG